MFRQSVLLLVALVTLISSPAYSQSSAGGMMPGVDSVFFNGLHYRLVGPSRGGRVTTVTGVPSQPKTFYMGVASGGLFKTIDGGASWNPITDGKIPLGSTGCVAVTARPPAAERRRPVARWPRPPPAPTASSAVPARPVSGRHR